MNREEIKKELLESIVPFWCNMEDKEFGGVCNYMSVEGIKDLKADKFVILLVRNIWFYSALYELYPREEVKAIATRYYNNLLSYYFDTDDGLVYKITYDNKPLSNVKNVYFQSFGIYALSRYAMSFSNDSALAKALELFSYVESNFKDSIGYIEQLPKGENIIADCGVNAEKTMNSVLHILEGYTELYIASKDEKVKKALTELINLVLDKVYNPKLNRLEVFFDNNYNSLSDYHSYGHDIEATWLVEKAVEVVGDDALKQRVYLMNDDICKEIKKTAFDGKALYNERVNEHLDTDRIWWVQAEAVLGFHKNAMRTGKSEYDEIAKVILSYIFKSLKSPLNEWYWKVDINNQIDNSDPLASAWKCPYHNGRMCIELLK